jgi:hypothetical protein
MKNLLKEFVSLKDHYEDLYNEYEKEKEELRNLCEGTEPDLFIKQIVKFIISLC